MEFIKPGLQFDFVGKRKLAIGISVALLLAGIITFIARGGMRTGIDFSGGTEVHLRFSEPVKADEIRGVVNGLGFGEPLVQSIGLGEDNEFLIRVPATGTEGGESVSDAMESALAERFGADSFQKQSEELVGPKAGQELRRQGILAVLLSFLGILIYVGIRFDFKFAAGGIIALVHDLLIVMTFFILFNKELTLTVIAALLTVIGYSINDTVVVFDRIRENRRFLRTKSLSEVINMSVNETLSRTILTSLTTLLVVVVLFILGGSVLNDFAFAMLIGVVAGTYSSIFIAAPIVIGWEAKKGTPAKRKR